MSKQLEFWPLKACAIGDTIPAGSKLVGTEFRGLTLLILYREEGSKNDTTTTTNSAL